MLTIVVIFLSFAAGGTAARATRSWNAPEDQLGRALFCVMTGSAFWSISGYILWGMGYELDTPMIDYGRMNDNASLPPVALFTTVVTYYIFKPKGTGS